MGSPAEYPDNEFTRSIEELARQNRAGASLGNRGIATTAAPQPTARSADLGQPVDEEDDPSLPLSAEKRAELDRLAAASGFVQGPVTPGIASALEGAGGDDGPYGSLEEAIAAGAPVQADEQAVAEGAARFREPGAPVRVVGAAQMRPMPTDRQTACEFLGRQREPDFARLPDFGKVQLIDLVNGRVYIDGLEFAVTVAELQALKKFAVETARQQIQAKLTEALKMLEGEDEAM